jgi:hypothetical protein
MGKASYPSSRNTWRVLNGELPCEFKGVCGIARSDTHACLLSR